MDWRLRLPSGLYRVARDRAGSQDALARVVQDFLTTYASSEAQTMPSINIALAELLAILADTLDTSARQADLALQATNDNEAIGTLVGLEERLTSALALYRAAVAFHRAKD